MTNMISNVKLRLIVSKMYQQVNTY